MTEGVNIEKVIQKVAEEAAETEGPAKPEAPAAEDVSQFEAAMQGETGRQAVSGADAPPEVTRASKVEEPQSLGDAILQGMEKAKEGHTDQVDRINALLDKSGDAPMTVQDAMKLQFELMQLNLQQEVTTKTADKTSQGVQTLFKNQ
jgi:type III secretion system YscI/HrpB-like protein